ncbi:MAG: KpsF/GutQ family sugar-phosphate isomerase [Acidobacteriota bacterium]
MSLDVARRILEMEAEAIRELLPRLDSSFERAVDLIRSCKGRVVLTGMGKSGIICQKIAATFTSTGTPALFLHPAEAIHGDLGMVVTGDLLVAVSYSGETEELLALLETLSRLDVPIVSLTGHPQSTLARHSAAILHVGIREDAGPMGLVPTVSTTAALAMGDALAIAVLEERGFKVDDFARLHPGGRLGKRLLTVEQVMHTGEQVPRVRTDTPMPEVIYEMSRKGLGITSVVDANDRMVGVISDGDLRRLLEREPRPLERTAGEIMHHNPATIARHELATHALSLLEQRKITSLLVLDEARRVDGIVHLHDLWRTQLI